MIRRCLDATALGLVVGIAAAGVVIAIIVMPYKAWKLSKFRAECDEFKGFVYHDQAGEPMCLTSNWKIIAVIR